MATIANRATAETAGVELLVKNGLLSGDLSRLQAHPKYLGPVDKIGYLARQTRSWA
jgi:hypothetical protein